MMPQISGVIPGSPLVPKVLQAFLMERCAIFRLWLTWFRYKFCKVSRFRKAQTLIERIKDHVRYFLNNSDVHMFKYFMNLKNFVSFQITWKDFKVKLIIANKGIKELCKKFIEDKFKRLDIAQKIREKQQQWSWSPIFYIIKDGHYSRKAGSFPHP